MKENFDPEKLSIDEFKLVNGDISAPFDFDSNKIEKYDTNMSFNVSFNIEAKMVKADIGFMIETVSKTVQDEAKANFDFVYIIHIDNLDELVTLTKKGAISKVEHVLLNSISAITYSTSRGVLMTRLQGTVMSDYILPIISPNNLFALDDKTSK